MTNPQFFRGGVDVQAPAFENAIIGTPEPVVVMADLSTFSEIVWFSGASQSAPLVTDIATAEVIAIGKPLFVEALMVSCGTVSTRMGITDGASLITVTGPFPFEQPQQTLGRNPPQAIIQSGRAAAFMGFGTFLLHDRLFRNADSSLGEAIGWYDYDLEWFVPAGSRLVLQSGLVQLPLSWNLQVREGERGQSSLASPA